LLLVLVSFLNSKVHTLLFFSFQKTDLLPAHPLFIYVIDIGELDAVTVVLRYPSGAIGTIDNNRCAGYGYDQRMEIFGSVGYLHLDNQTKSSTVTSSHSSTTSPGNYQGRERLISGMERYGDAYEEEVHHFLDVLTGKVPKSEVTVTSNDIYRASKIADAAIKSFKTGERVQISYD
jgi:myo-inositol 2-dehydrogenase/D-chiro-inositol 1-dehydrogenase